MLLAFLPKVALANKYEKCKSLLEINTICVANLEQIHPTQSSVGNLVVLKKIKVIESKHKTGKLKKYLLKKAAPAIVGPDGQFYIIDKHHSTYSLYKADIPASDKKLYLKVIHNWSQLSSNEFEAKMIEKNYIWPLNSSYEKIAFSDLPTQIRNLSDDPYRSLAWLVRENGGFSKTSTPYAEFYWGMYFFKSGLTIAGRSLSDFSSVLPKALELAKSSSASHLPGYIPSL